MTTTVMEAVPPPGETVRFVDQVVRDAPGDISFIYFSWRRALTAKYSVIHFHWPELLIRDNRAWHVYLRYVAFLLLLARLKVRRVKVVRTVHNVAPHTRGPALERYLLRALSRMTNEFVTLNRCTPLESSRSTYIPHGDYREQFNHFPTDTASPGRLLFVGRIEPYKRVPHLIDVVSNLPSGVDELRIVGRPSVAEAIEITRAQERYTGSAALTFSLAYVTDEQMVLEISRAEAVILPYEEMHNSGILLVALSLGRPIIAPRSCVNSEVRSEVGDGWIAEYEGDLTPQSLASSLTVLRSVNRHEPPKLTARSWQVVAEQYADVFRA